MTPLEEMTAYITQGAIDRGMDPATALKVARAEALNVFDFTRPDLGGDEGSSFGPYQLHYAGMSKNMPNAGLGDEFTKLTGLDARDPSTWKQQVDFSLDWANKHGWAPWMGAKAAGVGEFEGLRGGQPASAVAGLFARQPTSGPATQAFRPALGDVVAPQQVETTDPLGGDIASLGLGFLTRAEERQAREAEAERERRQALFAQPTIAFAPMGLSGLYR